MKRVMCGILVSISACLSLGAVSPAAASLHPRRDLLPFPAVGHVFSVDFGTLALDLEFKSAREVICTATKGAEALGRSETMIFHAVMLRPDQFALTWSDATGRVTQMVQDFRNLTVDSFQVLADGSTTHLHGTLRRKK